MTNPTVMDLLPIYLDYAATTPVDPSVVQKMQQCLSLEGIFGNSASLHPFGLAAFEVIEAARKVVADVVCASPKSIIWTSGATESNNLAIQGIARFYQQKGK